MYVNFNIIDLIAQLLKCVQYSMGHLTAYMSLNFVSLEGTGSSNISLKWVVGSKL